MSTTLRAELFWGRQGPELALPRARAPHQRRRNPTCEEAQRACLDAIAFALEGDPADYDPAARGLGDSSRRLGGARRLRSPELRSCAPG
jgi:hypothetical protein